MHLRTDVERRAYLILAEAPGMAWTVASVARHANVDRYDVDVALRQFEAAGIVERVQSHHPGPRRYRWRSEMDYLKDPGTPAPAARRDPICGMPVASESAHRERSADGAEQLFCSLRCHLAWRVLHRPESGEDDGRPRQDQQDSEREPR